MMRFTLILILATFAVSAQVDSVYTGAPTSDSKHKRKPANNDWLKKITYGGDFHAWFGNPSSVFLSPTIGYSPVKEVNFGIGMIYNYFSTDAGPYGRYTQSVFGGHSYIRYIIANSYMLQVQYDRLNQPNLMVYPQEETIWINYLLVGGGFRHRINDKAALTSSLMYNLTPNRLSIYPSRLIIQFGFIGGF